MNCFNDCPVDIDFCMPQGATFRRVLRWREKNGPNRNLTGFTARMQLRATADSATVLEELTTENGGITLGGSEGTISLLLTAAETIALTAGRVVYDLELIASNGEVTQLTRGIISVTRNVTR